MPQMAPIYWLFMFFFFVSSLLLFFMFNYFMKPFSKVVFAPDTKFNSFSKSWKL